jgi:hypothetical protein
MVKHEKNPLHSLSCDEATEILEEVANGAYGPVESKEIEMIKERRLGRLYFHLEDCKECRKKAIELGLSSKKIEQEK